MDFDNRKVYGDTSITDGLVYIYRVFFLTGPQGPGNFQGPELLAAPGIFQGGWKFSGPGNFQAPWKFPGPLENSRGVLISGQTRCGRKMPRRIAVVAERVGIEGTKRGPCGPKKNVAMHIVTFTKCGQINFCLSAAHSLFINNSRQGNESK